jgi:DNA repair exonuclease SbcCD nuclease subunit
MIGTTAFTLVPFRDRKSFSVDANTDALSIIHDSLIYELASIPMTYKKMLVGHLAIEGSIPVGDEIDDITNELFCPLDMFKGYDYVWMGHVHKPQVMKKKDPYIAHVGSMDISNFGETDHKKHIVIVDCLSPNHDFEIEYLPTRPLRKFSIIIPKDTEDTTAFVIEEIKKTEQDLNRSIVRVEVSLAVPELKSINKCAIEKFLAEQGAFNVTGIMESKKIALIKKAATKSIDTKMEALPAIKAWADAHVDAEMHNSFIELAVEIVAQQKAEAKE